MAVVCLRPAICILRLRRWEEIDVAFSGDASAMGLEASRNLSEEFLYFLEFFVKTLYQYWPRGFNAPSTPCSASSWSLAVEHVKLRLVDAVK